MKRDYEIQQRALEGNWVELRIVYEIDAEPEMREYHLRGADARIGLTQWVLTFASALAYSAQAPSLSEAIMRLWNHIHSLKCSCNETHH